jgi:hypothetical protein
MPLTAVGVCGSLARRGGRQEGNLVTQTQTQARQQRSNFAVLADIARMARDAERRPRFREDPFGTVEGFASLPEQVQAMFRDMGDRELAAIGRMCEDLVDGGFAVEMDGMRLCMF